jgi:RNA polymerase-associated protein CTR9
MYTHRLFAQLASDPAPAVPYNKDVADQRRKYGENLLRKAEDQLQTQRAHQSESRGKLDAARAKRDEERARQKQVEDLRLEELRIASDRLAEERREANKKAQEWTKEVENESEEEGRKKAERAAKRATRKVRGAEDDGSGAEDGNMGNGNGTAPPKRKRVKRRVKEEGNGDDGEEALFSADEGEEKPKKVSSMRWPTRMTANVYNSEARRREWSRTRMMTMRQVLLARNRCESCQ